MKDVIQEREANGNSRGEADDQHHQADEAVVGESDNHADGQEAGRLGVDAAQHEMGHTAAQPAVALSHDIQETHSGRHNNRPPKGTTLVRTYDGLRELLHAFAGGLISLLVIVARPGLGKSKRVRQALMNQPALVIKLRKSPLDFYTDLYNAKDEPVCLDDADNLLSQPLCREYVKALTETDKYRRIDYGTKTHILEDEGVPKYFWTTSPVCLIANHWNSRDATSQALESRAEFIYFDPDWCEVYREVGSWFWDQEIYDYVWDRLNELKEPDMRLFIKAYNRKKARLAQMAWNKLIDAHVDDAFGLAIRRLLDDQSFKSNTARALAFRKETGADRATFYRRLNKIKRYRPQARPPRIVLERTVPPVEPRPADGVVAGNLYLLQNAPSEKEK